MFAKILKKIVKDKLVSHLQKNNLLSNQHYGFKKHLRSRVYAFKSKTINSNKQGMLVFLDVAKAFDAVERDKLLLKLEASGVKANAHEWFKSYFTAGSILGVISDVKTVDYNAIQKSCLGHVLFLIYINNPTKINSPGKFFLFSDNDTIFNKSQEWELLYELVLRDLSNIKKWYDQNLLTLNISKTKFMLISLYDKFQVTENIKLHTCRNFQRVNYNCDEMGRNIQILRNYS